MKTIGEDKGIEFRLRTIFSRCAVNRGLNINIDRYQVRTIDEGAGKYLAEGMLLLATQEDEVFDFPNNFLIRWGRKWHTLKVHFPRWCRRFCPCGITRVWAIHKFPDVNVPAEFFGSEYVSFREIKEEDLGKIKGS